MFPLLSDCHQRALQMDSLCKNALKFVAISARSKHSHTHSDLIYRFLFTSPISTFVTALRCTQPLSNTNSTAALVSTCHPIAHQGLDLGTWSLIHKTPDTILGLVSARSRCRPESANVYRAAMCTRRARQSRGVPI